MLPDIENLLKLQDADKEIRRLQDEVAEFPKRVAVIEQSWRRNIPPLDGAAADIGQLPHRGSLPVRETRLRKRRQADKRFVFNHGENNSPVGSDQWSGVVVIEANVGIGLK